MFCHSPQAPQKAVAAYRGPPWDTAKLPFGEETSCQKVRHFATKSKFRCVFFFFSIPYLLGKSNAPPDSVTNKTPRSAMRFGAFELNQGTHCNSRLVVWERLQARGHWVGRCGGASFPPLQCTASYGISRQRFGYRLRFYPPPFSTELYSRIYFRINRTVSTYIKGLIFFSRALPVMRFSSVQEMTPMVIPSEML